MEIKLSANFFKLSINLFMKFNVTCIAFPRDEVSFFLYGLYLFFDEISDLHNFSIESAIPKFKSPILKYSLYFDDKWSYKMSLFSQKQLS